MSNLRLKVFRFSENITYVQYIYIIYIFQYILYNLNWSNCGDLAASTFLWLPQLRISATSTYKLAQSCSRSFLCLGIGLLPWREQDSSRSRNNLRLRRSISWCYIYIYYIYFVQLQLSLSAPTLPCQTVQHLVFIVISQVGHKLLHKLSFKYICKLFSSISEPEL